MRIIEYQTYREEEILPLYASVGWTAYTDAPDALRRGFVKSLLTLAAYEEKTLVGLARAVGDGDRGADRVVGEVSDAAQRGHGACHR